MSITDAELDALEAAAKAATPGQKRDIEAYSAFIAAANPAAVLELIAELRQARLYMVERHAFRAAWKEERVLQNMLAGWLESIAKGETPACMVECKTAHDFVSYAAWVDAKQRGLPCSETFGKSNGE